MLMDGTPSITSETLVFDKHGITGRRQSPAEIQSLVLSSVAWSIESIRAFDLSRAQPRTSVQSAAILSDLLPTLPRTLPGMAPIAPGNNQSAAVDLPLDESGMNDLPTQAAKAVPEPPPEAPMILGRSVVLDPGTTVVAPVSGKVLHAAPLRGWQGIVLLDVGDNRTLIVSGLRQLLVRRGQQVLRGDPIGISAEMVGLSVRIGELETAVETVFGREPDPAMITAPANP
jgi:biotin carboxyl carrier protein